MRKVIISAALTGGRKAEPGDIRPIQPDEIARDVVACAKAGAAACHIHAHNKEGLGTQDIEVFREIDTLCRKAIKEAGVDVMLNYTTSFGAGEARWAPVVEFHPEICSYDSGSLNWSNDGLFLNSPSFLADLGDITVQTGVKAEIEIFNINTIKWALRMYERGHLKAPLHFQIVLGTYGGMDASVENLNFLVNKLPKDCTWSVSGIGKESVPMMMAGLALGANGVRVGLEDNMYMSRGVHATNVLQVERAVKLLKLANCEPATAAEAREILSLPPYSYT